MAATHNVCGTAVTAVYFNNPSGTPIGYRLICAQCQTEVTVAEITGNPTADAVSTGAGT